jgi:apolipoprotein D and lipocalin family protein
LNHERHRGLSASDRGRRRAFAAFDAATLGVGALIASCARPVGNPRVPEPAKPVELSRYLGRWYEIARYDSSFERGCEGVTAEYSLRPYGLIRVLNACRMGSPEGRSGVAEGKAKLSQARATRSSRRRSFGPFFFGSYWVLDHADDYSWSIVGEPTDKYLWILSRGATPVDADRQALVQRAQELGYDTSLLASSCASCRTRAS